VLVLTRRAGQGVVIGDDMVVRVLSIDGDRVSLGFVAPRRVLILRQELLKEG
jgi:carbon storage regulator